MSVQSVVVVMTIVAVPAYSAEIAEPALASQNLSASPNFLFNRTTWIKPSWNWMMYRSGYSYKSPLQSRILAITMKRERFEHLLSLACVTHGLLSEEERSRPVRVQWDPERSVDMQKLEYRSIQIGIGRRISEVWVKEWVEGIEDVTERARRVKELVEEGRVQEARMLVPEERPYPLSKELEEWLKMV
ncbi:hypothetical protein K440DRAFT_656095 [Wilcoxina mikolae CBS 423.85]|nr:hypothetical protein K440DRAFT_656095 [Wilcoxina mikolae CBS 423.85]